MQQIGVAQGKKQNGEQEGGGRGWSSLAKPSCDGHVAGRQRGGSGEACAKTTTTTTKGGTSTRDAVRGTRFTVRGSRCIVGARRECESWTRAGEDGAGSVRAPQRSANTPKPVQDGSQAE
jgi:hypothetical protein